ncbi:MAG: hypothetical protein R6U02_06965 [Alkalibacterium sp.]
MFMSGVRSVDEWNDRRQEAKDIFGGKLINELDASGYIKKLSKGWRDVY